MTSKLPDFSHLTPDERIELVTRVWAASLSRPSDRTRRRSRNSAVIGHGWPPTATRVYLGDVRWTIYARHRFAGSHTSSTTCRSSRLQDPSYEERFVMTTVHGGESVEEVVRLFIHNTRFEQHDFDQFLALLVGSDAAIERRIVTAVREELPELPLA